MNRRRQPFLAAPSSIAADPDGFRAALARRGQAFGAVRGDSMTPTLLDGDVVRVVPVAGVRRGQVLAFEDAHGKVVTHRAVRVDERAVTCRGDNRDRCDAAVPRAAVIGRVVEVVGGAPLVDDGLRLAAAAGLAAGQARAAPAPAPQTTSWANWRCFAARVEGRASGTGHSGTAGSLERPATMSSFAAAMSAWTAASPWRPEWRQDARIVVPAAVFCRLAPRSRLTLLGALHGRPVTVFAYARPARGVLLRSLAWVRAAARRSGRDWGAPGDAVMRDGSGATVHLFSAGELEAEVGGQLGEVGVTSIGGPLFLLRGETARPARQDDQAAPATAR